MLLNLPFQKKYLIAPLFLSFMMIGLHMFEPYSSEVFGFYINQVIAGEWWRVVTGQLLHTNTNHLLLNLSGVLLIWALHGEHYTVSHYVRVITAQLVLIGLMLTVFADYGHYAGFSGVLHGMLIYGAIIDIIKQEKTGWLLLLGTSLKVAYENIAGAAEETKTLINAEVATEAHLIGVIIGCVLALCFFYYQSITKK